MRRLVRNLDQSFPPDFTGNTRIDWELDLLTERRSVLRDEKEKIKFLSGRWKGAKVNLIAETLGKCAYCEVNFTTVAYGDVEHYRPKSVYWWLAYAYLNYLPSCQLCNQKFKKAEFPIPVDRLRPPTVRRNSTDAHLGRLSGSLSPDPLDDAAGMAMADFLSLHAGERPLSLDPYVDEPSDFLAYEFDDNTEEVWIVPLNNTVSDIVISCIDLYGLNRKDLLDKRYKALKMYRAFREIIDLSNQPTVRHLAQVGVNDLLADDTEFCGMFRFFEDHDMAPLPIDDGP